MVAADIDDEASLTAALQGAHGAYFVTFFWEHRSPEKEIAEVRSMAGAAKAAGVAHVIWSTLEDTRQWIPLPDTRMPTLMGEYKVPHFDAKGESNAVFTALGVPTTFLYTSFYWDNLIHFGMGPKQGPDGTLAFTLPMGNMFQFNSDFEQVFCAARSVEVSRALNPSLQTFSAWLVQNKAQIPLE